ncbi:hypothetical protein [Streptomyces sp. CC224B]|uniref:hypothetical protein n=1 Tax=Streptomyces sp. CC224B TaxID=3044571 RepID=UPI0024A7DEF8|nr:hypothetical protein [Streptomyces sp. CC224B]
MDSYHLKSIRAQMVEAFLAEQKRQREDFDQKITDLDERIRKAEGAEAQERQDPEVLVRGSMGAVRSVYHRAANPCGRTVYNGGRSRGFMRMRESKAKQMDGGTLTRCRACWG